MAVHRQGSSSGNTHKRRRRKTRGLVPLQRKKVSEDPSVPRTKIFTASELKDITAKIDEERKKKKKRARL